MSARNNTQTYYEVLEITTSTPHHEVVAAYQRAKEAYSPDSVALYSMFSSDEAAELRKLIEEAFLVLGNPAKRKAYDETLLRKNTPTDDLHQLPDFAPMPEETLRSTVTPSHSIQNTRLADTLTEPSRPSNSVPNGFAKSRLSVYEINNELELEIKNQTHFDGAFLKKVRQYKNINIEQLSKETRISRSYLAAIEAEDFDALPAPVFLRGFIVQYARILGLNEILAASSYMSRVKKG